jgi:hypothetical protein
MERIAAALESIAESFRTIAEIERLKFDTLFPHKGPPTDATISYVKTDEDDLRESQGQSQESLEDWIGPFEKAWKTRSET